MTSEMIAAPAPKALDLALLKAVGLDRAAPEQRELAIHIADRYGLDLMLKHLVLIDGKPYITRDALLHIAHRSGQFDGISTTTPEVVGDEWRCSATVWRRDMTHPFTYGGRYPVKGRNANFAPEMAIKVAESMALRRAFNVAAPVVEERWDVDLPPAEPEPKLTLAGRAAAAEIVVTDPQDALAKTPQEAAEAVAVKRAARVEAETPITGEFTAEEIAEALAEQSGGGCGFRIGLAKGGEIVPCTFAPDHDGDHSWKDRAMSEGGRVIRPEAA